MWGAVGAGGAQASCRAQDSSVTLLSASPLLCITFLPGRCPALRLPWACHALQVTQAVLRHDIEDAWRLQQGTLGCHASTAPEIDAMQPTIFGGCCSARCCCAAGEHWAKTTPPVHAMRSRPAAAMPACCNARPPLPPPRPALPPAAGCGALPEAIHPHSFRAVFGRECWLAGFLGVVSKWLGCWVAWWLGWSEQPMA